MILAQVVGTVVSTRKDSGLLGFKLLLAREVDHDIHPTGSWVVAADAGTFVDVAMPLRQFNPQCPACVVVGRLVRANHEAAIAASTSPRTSLGVLARQTSWPSLALTATSAS